MIVTFKDGKSFCSPLRMAYTVFISKEYIFSYMRVCSKYCCVLSRSESLFGAEKKQCAATTKHRVVWNGLMSVAI